MFTSIRIIIRATSKFVEHDCLLRGAALAYYTLFSFPPLMLLAVMMAGAIFGTETAERKVFELTVEYVGEDNANLTQSVVDKAATAQGGGWVSYFAVGISVVAALQIFLHIRRAFCSIWELDKPGQSAVAGIIINYILSVVMVLCTGVLLLISLVVTVLISRFAMHTDISNPTFWSLFNLVCSFLYLLLIFTCVFWVLAGNSISFRHVLYGAVICTILFLVGKILLAWYLALTAKATIYGAANVLVGFLIWIYYSSQIVFFGAELIQARRTRAEWLPS
ncbi:MAG: YihY/virulence factor BrkB family protein [Gemmataceae bacterium]